MPDKPDRRKLRLEEVHAKTELAKVRRELSNARRKMRDALDSVEEASRVLDRLSPEEG